MFWQHSNTRTFKSPRFRDADKIGTIKHQKMKKKLQNVLKANAIFSIFSGSAMLCFGNSIAGIMTISNAIILMIIGSGLILFGGFVWYQATRQNVNSKEIKAIIIQDWLWVVGSVVIIGLQLFQISFQGYVLMGIVALIVADFAFFQNYYLKRGSIQFKNQNKIVN